MVALYFRTNQTSATGGQGSVAVISTLLMLPVAVLIPWMFSVRCFVRVFTEGRTGNCLYDSKSKMSAHSYDCKHVQASQSFLSRTVHEMIQHHRELKREIREAKGMGRSSSSIKAGNDQQDLVQSMTLRLKSMESQDSQSGQKQKQSIATNSSISETNVLVLKKSPFSGPTSPALLRSLPPEESLVIEDSPDSNEDIIAPKDPNATAAPMLEGSKKTRQVAVQPAPNSLQSSAVTPAGQSTKATAAVAPALSAEQQNIWNKAEQVFKSESICLATNVPLRCPSFRMGVLATHTICMLLRGTNLHRCVAYLHAITRNQRFSAIWTKLVMARLNR